MLYQIFATVLVLSLANAFVHQQPRLRTAAPMQMIFNFGAKKSSIPANKKLVVVTGTTSGLGKATLKSLLSKENYYVICAVRDVEKMKQIAEKEGYDKSNYAVLNLDLASFDSTRKFVTSLNSLKGSRPLDRLVCNAAVYQPAFDKVRTSRSQHHSYLHLLQTLLY